MGKEMLERAQQQRPETPLLRVRAGEAPLLKQVSEEALR
jgi:hypothetical protein